MNAVQKLVSSYEHIDPELVGNQRRILVSDLSGRSNIVMKAQELGFKVANDTPELKNILNRIKELEHAGYEFEAAEGSLALLIHRRLKNEAPPFVVEAYHVSMRRDSAMQKGLEGKSVCEATVKVCVGDKFAHTAADGDGPVNALDSALRNALVSFFPQLKRVQLTDYKVRILDGEKVEPVSTPAKAGQDSGTASKIRVLIESTDGKETWGTVGVSTNIIEASLQALVDSLEYGLLKRGKKV